MVLLSMLFTAATHNYKLPSGLLSALCYVESTHNPKAINFLDGKDDSLGICQVQEQTARFLKFNGLKEDLFKPKVNIKYAAKYLSYQLKRYDNDVYKAVAAYNAGTFLPNKVGLAKNDLYVRKVLAAWSKGK